MNPNNFNLKFSKNTLKPIVNKSDFKKLFKNKSRIDNIKNWHIYRNITNDHEQVARKKLDFKPISRAYFKLWELLKLFEKDIGILNKKKCSFATFAEAPGGFVQSLQHYRKKFVNIENDAIYGISLKDGNKKTGHDIKWELDTDNFHIIFGDPNNKNHDGNLINPEILSYFISLFNGKKASIATADGGFLLSDIDENFKESYHIPLFFAETLGALSVLEKGGIFIFKIYDVSIKPMFDILHILNNTFREVNIVKPLTSRPANSEKYIVAIGYNGISKKLKKKLFQILQQLWENEQKEEKEYVKSFIDIQYDDKFMKNIIDINSKYIKNQNEILENTISLIKVKRNELDKIKVDRMKFQKNLAIEFLEYHNIINTNFSF
jgi:23S rRNA U2552 (ribose-2'-O)-methylase RlmE/FtsJ